MVSHSIRILCSITSILLHLTAILCLQNDHVYQQSGHDDWDQHSNQELQHSHTSSVNGEITTEHLLRYWGSTTDQMVDSMHIAPKAVNIYPDTNQQQDQNPHLDVRSVNIEKNGVFVASLIERNDINQLRRYITHSGSYSRWLQSISDTEILRFLRARKGNIDAAWVMLWENSIWRQSPMGSETLTAVDNQIFEASSLNDELYWAGQAYDGNPVLFFRSGLHESGADAQLYSRFVVWLLEKGIAKYKIGQERQLYIVIDRTPSNRQKEHPFTSLGTTSVTGNLPILKAIFQTVQDNYPEILCKAFIVPVNLLTRTLFVAASVFIDEKSKSKINLIRNDDSRWFESIFHPNILTIELGGHSTGNIDLYRNSRLHEYHSESQYAQERQQERRPEQYRSLPQQQEERQPIYDYNEFR